MSDIYSKYVQDWMPKDERILPFYVGMDDFLKEYLVSSNKDYEKLQPKIIADPLLGYIHLSALEVAIVDTKLFQRLRKIKQLGLAFLVFPSLGYSRFEHSLGVLGRLNQVLHKLIENSSRETGESRLKKIIDENATALRIAALMHDVGHCIFSHCSERVIQQVKGENNYPDAQLIQSIFSEKLKKEKSIPFAELFTLSIIGSKQFHAFIEDFSLYNTKDAKKILENAGRFVLGMPLAGKPETLFLSQLISSGLDVDKIDYMMREQQYSGIKLEIDLDRILSKLNVFNLKSYELPKNLEFHKRFFDAETYFEVLGFEKGGQFAFEEFCIARLALHVKIYLHQKVRAAESQLSKYLENLLDNATLKEVHNWLRLTESIIELPQAMHFNYPATVGSLFEFKLSKEQIDAFLNIDQRNLYHRAFAFGPMNSYSEGYGAEAIESKVQKLETYFNQFEKSNLKEKIIHEAFEICEKYDIEVNYGSFKEIVIEFPRLLNIQQGQESLHFERASWLPLKWTIPIDKILIYFQENRALAYVFAPKNVAHIIAIASEITLFKISEKVFSQDSNISKNTLVDFVHLKNELNNKGLYTQFPQLKPVSEYLQKAEASEKIKDIQEKLISFKSLNDEYITINRITTFVNQFPNYLQEACLSFLQHIQIFSENLLKEELEKVLHKLLPSDKKIGVTYLGSVADSGGHLAYYIRPVLEAFEIEPLEFNDSLVLENDKLIFYDDNINSGLQLINIFAEIVDEKDKLIDCRLNEKHHKKLATNEARAKFKEMPKYIVYTVGNEDALNRIRTSLESLGFNIDNINISIRKVLRQDERIFSGAETNFNHALKKELRDYIAQIGEKLLTAEKKSEEKINSCKLGYSNAEAMVFFPYNIPTMTITALWCKGDMDGIPWIPLAERRRRSTKNGKYIGED